MQIPFYKCHSLGNDFIIIDKSNIKNIDINKLVKEASNYKTGIGCDQFILYKKRNIKSEFDMHIFNSSGSEALACGNASLCLAEIIYNKYNIKESQLFVHDNIVVTKYISNNKAEVIIKSASFDKEWMPNLTSLWELASEYELKPKDLICVDMGNPHLVIFSENLTYQDKKILGNKIVQSRLFKDGVNVNFVEIHNEDIFLKVWERGVGFTLSCGSGACASFIAAHKMGFVKEKSKVYFELGYLNMHYTNNSIKMSGNTKKVIDGLFFYE